MARVVSLITLACLLTLPTAALSHGEQGWVMKYVNAENINCCHEIDTAEVSQEDAAAARVGSEMLAVFPTGPDIVRVNIIHATEDKDGRAFVTKYGCLFRQFGG